MAARHIAEGDRQGNKNQSWPLTGIQPAGENNGKYGKASQ